jgi:hypothetical protein
MSKKESRNNPCETDPLPGFEISIYPRCPCCRYPLLVRMGVLGPGYFCECNPEPVVVRAPGGWNKPSGMRVDDDNTGAGDTSRGSYLVDQRDHEGGILRW